MLLNNIVHIIDHLLLDALIIATGWALGNILLNNFEKHLSWARRLSKFMCILILAISIDAFFGKMAFAIVLGAMTLGIIILHGCWFPKRGINGRTAEPLNKYYELIGHKKK